jgi:hypothetical protein
VLPEGRVDPVTGRAIIGAAALKGANRTSVEDANNEGQVTPDEEGLDEAIRRHPSSLSKGSPLPE